MISSTCWRHNTHLLLASRRRVFGCRGYNSITQILPDKRILRRYLFRNKIPLSYRLVLQCYENALADSDAQSNLPANVKGRDLMGLKRVLEQIRKEQGFFSKDTINLERLLVESAAESGDPSAIAILCGSRLSDPNVSKDDLEHGERLLEELCKRKDATALKVAGDLAFNRGFVDQALKLYKMVSMATTANSPSGSDSHSIAEDFADEDLTLVIESLRSAGIILYGKKEYLEAKLLFEKAISQAILNRDPKQAAHCHYYLAQILAETNKVDCRYHLEQAARYGVQDAFADLGFLNMNYFGEGKTALQWFLLGWEAGITNCLIGLYDHSVKFDANQKDHWLELLQTRLDKEAYAEFAKSRAVETVLTKKIPSDATQSSPVESKTPGRWDL